MAILAILAILGHFEHTLGHSERQINRPYIQRYYRQRQRDMHQNKDIKTKE